jgi:hypothetical protein
MATLDLINKSVAFFGRKYFLSHPSTPQMLVDKERVKHCLTLSLFISFFSDNFSRLHLRELCYTGSGRKAKIGIYISLKGDPILAKKNRDDFAKRLKI